MEPIANSTASDLQGDPATIVADYQRRARRFETQCGDGSLVWHTWGSGAPLLLLHGAQGSWRHWIRNIDALAAEHAVWAIDIPGYGESAPPPRQDHRAISDVVASGLLQLLGQNVRIDVIGFSLGGVISAHFAVFYPDLVRRLILVDTGGLDTPMGEVNLQRVSGLQGEDRKAANRANLLTMMLRHPASVDELALHLQAGHATRGRLDAASLVVPNKLREALPRIATQLDAIWGELDQPHPNPAAQERVLREFHPDMDFRVIPDAGHWVMYERAAAFNSALLGLLDEPLRRPRAK